MIFISKHNHTKQNFIYLYKSYLPKEKYNYYKDEKENKENKCLGNI